MKLLIAGGSGFLGSQMIEQAIKHGHQVTYLSRHPGEGELFHSDSVAYIQGDLLSAEEIVLNSQYDMLIDCVGSITLTKLKRLNRDTAQGAVVLCQQYGISKRLYVSAAGGYPAYLKSKREAEQLIAESGLTYMVVRPGLLYGSKRPSSLIQAKLIKVFARFPLMGKLVAPVYPMEVSQLAKAIVEQLSLDQESRVLNREDLNIVNS